MSQGQGFGFSAGYIPYASVSGYGVGAQSGVELRKSLQRRQIQIATERKGVADTEFFWSLVRQPTGEIAPRRVSMVQDEAQLFRSQPREEGAESHMDIYDNIPVERSGEGADKVPLLTSFKELLQHIPEFLSRNIERMQYDHPTPIQRHSVPLGLAGNDLMCCAQTGSGTSFIPSHSLFLI